MHTYSFQLIRLLLKQDLFEFLNTLSLCMLGNFACFGSRLLTAFKMNFFNIKIFHEHSQSVSNGLDPDQDRQKVGPDLGPNCFKCYEQTTKVATSKDRVWIKHFQ